MKKILALMLSALMMVAVFTGCNKSAGKDGETTGNGSSFKVQNGQTIATIKVKDFGEIKVALFPDVAPKAVENFTTHAKDGYYNGLKFHRIIADFMIQGGDPKGDGTGGESIWGKPFEDEFSSNARNFTGALSMANSGPATNGSQFFIVNSPPITVPDEAKEYLKSSGVETKTNYMSEYINAIRQNSGYEAIEYSKDDLKKYEKEGGTPWLDNAHTVFGQVYEGLDLVKKIMDQAASDSGQPTKDVIIESITISEYKG